jgi:hypothetical protein
MNKIFSEDTASIIKQKGQNLMGIINPHTPLENVRLTNRYYMIQ